MKLSTLKSLERSAYRMMKAVEAEAKSDPIARQLKESYSKLWNERHTAWKTAAIAHARRMDKGQMLFTIFLPERHSLTIIERTPNLVITEYWWRHSWAPGGLERSQAAPYSEVTCKYFGPDYHFDYYMHRKEAA